MGIFMADTYEKESWWKDQMKYFINISRGRVFEIGAGRKGRRIPD